MKRRDLVELESVLGFVASPPTRWLDPPELARTAAKAGLAKVFADYGDKREVQAVLPSEPAVVAPRSPDEIWIDYTADTGDGFDATATIATLLGAATLEVDVPDGDDLVLPRGDLLVLGGDAVYPAASARAYENRTIGPFSTAFPDAASAATPPVHRPTLLAVPGNHDWYDGLTSFLRVFARGARIGGWQTTQTRSYFVVSLGPGWWLVGLDSQLGEYIDEPQLAYFRTHLTEKLGDGDGVIVCTASPAWVHTKTKGPDGFNQLHYFDRNYVRTRPVPDSDERVPTGASVRLWLTGDTHHYSRYEEGEADDRPDPHAVQAITCGLGGAYLAETHLLPDKLELPPAASRMRSKDVPGLPMHRVGPTYPDAATSRRLFRRVANPFSRWWLGWRNPGFTFALGWAQLVAVWLLAAIVALVQPSANAVGPVLHGPLLTSITALAIVVGISLLCWVGHALLHRLFGVGGITATLGLLFQIVAACLTLLAMIALAAGTRAWGVPNPPAVVLLTLAAVFAWVVGGFVGTLFFGFFLLTQRTGTVASWRMSAQSIGDRKGFLRMRLAPGGDLEVYAIVVDHVCRDWETTSSAAGTRVIPAERIEGVRLLEGPIRISRTPRSPR